MQLNTFTKTTLPDFVNHPDYAALTDIPISRHRALSHVNNPLSKKDDVLLIVAMERNTVLGYLGLMPDRLYFLDGRQTRIAALSCIWVSPAARGKRLAETMVRKALELYDGKLVGSDYVPGIKKIYDRSEGFYAEPFNLPGFRIYLKSGAASVLPPKRPIFEKVKPLLKIGDAVVNAILSGTDYWKKPTLPSGITIVEADCFDEADQMLIDRQPRYAVLKRDIEQLNWILEFPWILEAPTKDALSQKYYFSSTEPFCRQRLVKVFHNEKSHIATLLFLHRNRHLKLSYLFYDADIQVVGTVVDYLMKMWHVHMFTSFDRNLNHYLQTSGRRGLYQKPIMRQYVIAKKYWDIFNEEGTVVHGGDLDAAFT